MTSITDLKLCLYTAAIATFLLLLCPKYVLPASLWMQEGVVDQPQTVD